MLDIIFLTILIMVFAVPILMNTIGPFVIWKTQKIFTVVRFEHLPELAFLQNQNPVFRQYDKYLVESGFISHGTSTLNGSHSSSFFRLYWHEHLRLSAMVVSIKARSQQLTYLEFTQRYTDGSILNVSNSTRQEAYPRLDIKLTYRFPDITEPDKLLKTHQKLRNKFKPMLEPESLQGTTGFSVLEDYIHDESDALVAKGIAHKAIDPDGKRSLTLYGAIVLTLRSIPPGADILNYLSKKRSEAALKNA